MPQAINDQEFKSDVLSSSKPVLVDFWAEWCGPCKMIAPVLEELDAEMGDQVDIRKLNIDENQETPMSYGIRSIPTLLLIKDGEVKGTKVGAVSKGELKSWIESQV
ncbi:MAG: thioredoxin [Alphaproteobacteria bacterium]